MSYNLDYFLDNALEELREAGLRRVPLEQIQGPQMPWPPTQQTELAHDNDTQEMMNKVVDNMQVSFFHIHAYQWMAWMGKG